jgi:hypothetical protein
MNDRKIPIVLVSIVFAVTYFMSANDDAKVEYNSPSAPIESTATEPAQQWRAGQQVRGSGTVVRILSDDNEGSRHQRFILRRSSGQTLLIAHNIDLAPRVESLREGDAVSFYGEYETNSQGGVIHWTHKDPNGRHADGYLQHNGRRYE